MENLKAEIERLTQERDEAREEAKDAYSTLNAWFDLRHLASEEVDKAVLDAVKGYLRVSSSGGMTEDARLNIEAAVENMVHLSLFSDLFARYKATPRLIGNGGLPSDMWKPLWDKYRSDTVIRIDQIVTEPVTVRARVLLEISGEVLHEVHADTVGEAYHKAYDAALGLLDDTPTARLQDIDRQLAALLLALEEDVDDDKEIREWYQHWYTQLPRMAQEEHYGDCTGQAVSCPRCLVDDTLTRARIITNKRVKPYQLEELFNDPDV